MAKMTNTEFVHKLIDVADSYKTVYGMGMPGMPITNQNINTKVNQDKLKPSDKRWWTKAREDRIRRLVGKHYFGFDCVCLEKAILWGWSGDFSRSLGGAKYLSNGVPDWGANYTIEVCKDVSTNFSNIEIGEAVWMKNHIGYYIGNGIVIEATPKWDSGVQRSNILNVERNGMSKSRTWVKHGKLPWVDYITKESDKSMTLYRGLKNDRVKQLQIDLIELGYSFAPYGADGSFGAKTEEVVKKFQADHGLEVDGRVGGKTRTKLADLLQDNLNQEDEELEKVLIELSKANAVIAAVKKALGV